MNRPKYFLLILLFFIICSCSKPEEISLFEAKMQTSKMMELKLEAADFGHLHYGDNSGNKWIIIYRKVKSIPELFIFNALRKKGYSHSIKPNIKKAALIEKLELKNLTEDDEPELLVFLHYNYGTSFQGRELSVFQYPFDKKNTMQVFSGFFEKVFEKNIGFDSTYGMPVNEKKIEFKANFSFYKEKIILKGIIDKKENHEREYSWNKYKDRFEKTKEGQIKISEESEVFDLEEDTIAE